MGNRRTLRTTPTTFAGLVLHLKADHQRLTRATTVAEVQAEHDLAHDQAARGETEDPPDHGHQAAP
jgi:hypothetical protein